MKLKFKKIAVGGTFDILHRGHKALLRKAFELGEEVIIGLTTDRFANEMKKRKVNPYEIRRKTLTEFILNEFPGRKFEISPISDPFGSTVIDGEIEALVLSEEKEKVAGKINAKRKERELKPLEVIVLPIVKAENGMKISSEYILKGIMDAEGRLLSK